MSMRFRPANIRVINRRDRHVGYHPHRSSHGIQEEEENAHRRFAKSQLDGFVHIRTMDEGPKDRHRRYIEGKAALVRSDMSYRS